MELLEAIKGRRAVRDYTGEDVADAKLRELIDAAIHAPSAMKSAAMVLRHRQKSGAAC